MLQVRPAYGLCGSCAFFAFSGLEVSQVCISQVHLFSQIKFSMVAFMDLVHFYATDDTSWLCGLCGTRELLHFWPQVDYVDFVVFFSHN